MTPLEAAYTAHPRRGLAAFLAAGDLAGLYQASSQGLYLELR